MRTRDETNALAAATAGRIAAGLAEMYAQSWGTGSRTVEIRELPSMTVRSAWAVGASEALDNDDARKVWRELGDGFYLFTARSGDARMHAVVNVAGTDVDIEPITEDQVGILPDLARSLRRSN